MNIYTVWHIIEHKNVRNIVFCILSILNCSKCCTMFGLVTNVVGKALLLVNKPILVLPWLFQNFLELLKYWVATPFIYHIGWQNTWIDWTQYVVCPYVTPVWQNYIKFWNHALIAISSHCIIDEYFQLKSAQKLKFKICQDPLLTRLSLHPNSKFSISQLLQCVYLNV